MPEVTDRHWTKKYDQYFRKYSKRFFGPALDWHWFKAQGIAESGLRGNATSWVNAKGIMQLMPRTFAELKKGNRAVGQVVGSIFIGIGVAIGLVIGLGLN